MKPQSIWPLLRHSLWVRLFAALTALAVITTVLDQRIGDLPEVGPLLSPYGGLWSHRSSFFEGKGEPGELKVAGLKGKVEVVVDDDQVKHVFAENDEDLYLAQGYIVASDRLWQMEFLTRLADGRLAEIVGPRALEYDRLFRRMGLGQAAKESAELMNQDELTAMALTQYVKGVNTYIASLKVRDLPFEYKLLGHRPEPWTIERVALLMKLMAYNLSGHSRDLPLTRTRAHLTQEEFDELFPLDLGIAEPIIPRGTRFSFPSRAPEPPAEPFLANIGTIAPHPTPHPANGSNNWAVTGRKSTTGLPILANDVHLGFGVPSLWYQIQLVSPSQNVYGVTLPGTPGVVLGFNKKLAWAVTNGGSDVLDWYELRYRDEKKHEYLYEGEWRPVISSETEIKVRDQKSAALLLRRTHLGPVIYDESEEPVNSRFAKGLVMRWAALEASNELKTFLKLNRADTTEQCKEALESFNTPDMNFICADNRGDVGLWHNGKYPIRWTGQGRTVSDGSSASYDWLGWFPREELPVSRNPERGFVSSANQVPADGLYPHYLGWPFESPFRGMRINEVLRAKGKLSPEDMIALQNDTLSVLARELTPALLQAIGGETFSELEGEARDAVQKWDFRFEEESLGATISSRWLKVLERMLWRERLSPTGEGQLPPLVRTLKLVREEPESKWFDRVDTPERETLRELARESFREAIAELKAELGSDVEDWRWAGARTTRFQHVAKIPGLGTKELEVRGERHAVFANDGDHGPVWKLVVALGPTPKAWGIYPGGQSGDPASRHYDDFIEPWRRGELKELVYLDNPGDANPRLYRVWRMVKQ